MAFKLTKIIAGEFRAKIGAKFIVKVNPVNGGPHFLIHSVCYGDVCITAPPFEFTAVSGLKGLTAVYDWDQPNEFVRLSEIDGGTEQTLRQRRYDDSSPFIPISIEGV